MAERECKLCEKYGITCRVGGTLDFAPRVMTINGGGKFRIDHPIEECDAVTKKTTPKKLANVMLARVRESYLRRPDNMLG